MFGIHIYSTQLPKNLSRSNVFFISRDKKKYKVGDSVIYKDNRKKQPIFFCKISKIYPNAKKKGKSSYFLRTDKSYTMSKYQKYTFSAVPQKCIKGVVVGCVKGCGKRKLEEAIYKELNKNLEKSNLYIKIYAKIKSHFIRTLLEF